MYNEIKKSFNYFVTTFANLVYKYVNSTFRHYNQFPLARVVSNKTFLYTYLLIFHLRPQRKRVLHINTASKRYFAVFETSEN